MITIDAEERLPEVNAIMRKISILSLFSFLNKQNLTSQELKISKVDSVVRLSIYPSLFLHSLI